MSKELFPDYARTHHQQRAEQAMRAVEHERLVKLARSNPHGGRRFFFTRLITLLRKVKALRRPARPVYQPTVRPRRVG